MLRFTDKRVYLACGKTDVRKSINGLMMIVESSFNLDPFDDAIFVFCNKRRNRVKILELFRYRNNSNNPDNILIPTILEPHLLVECNERNIGIRMIG